MSQPTSNAEVLHEGWRFAALIGSKDPRTEFTRSYREDHLEGALWATKVALNYAITDIHTDTPFKNPHNAILSFAHSAKEVSMKLSDIPVQREPMVPLTESRLAAFRDSYHAVQDVLAGEPSFQLLGAHIGHERHFYVDHCVPDKLYRVMPDGKELADQVEAEDHRFWDDKVWHEVFELANFSPLPDWGTYMKLEREYGLAV